MNLKNLILCGFAAVNLAFASDICDLEIVKNEIQIVAQKSVITEEGKFSNAKCENDKLIFDFLYNDEVSDFFLNKITPKRSEEILNDMQNSLNFTYCKMTGKLSEFRKQRVFLIYNYFAEDKFLFSIKVDKKTCQK